MVAQERSWVVIENSKPKAVNEESIARFFSKKMYAESHRFLRTRILVIYNSFDMYRYQLFIHDVLYKSSAKSHTRLYHQ